jgi:hypothetical protein
MIGYETFRGGAPSGYYACACGLWHRDDIACPTSGGPAALPHVGGAR